MRNWIKALDERQQKEIEFSRLYANQFNHGTDGHSAKVIISNLSRLLDKISDLVNVELSNGQNNADFTVRKIAEVLNSKELE